MFARNRHNVTMRADLFRPLPPPPEVVSDPPKKPAGSGVVLLDAESGVELSLAAKETDQLFGANALYREAIEGLVSETPGGSRSWSAPVTQPRTPLFGSGTMGVPRRGSRTIRLFRTDAAQLGHGLRVAEGSDRLVLRRYRHQIVLDEPELRAWGQLYGSYYLRPWVPVEVSVRVFRFSCILAAVEVKLESNRHPRRFFRAAHDAIDALDLPGR